MTDSITVMMAAKDCHKTLAKSMFSCLQNLRSDDFVNVFLDGYDSQLKQIADSFRDHRVRVMWSETSIGLLATRQALLDSVQTPFAAVVDSDDYCLPGRFSIPMAAIQKGEANMVFGNSAFIFENGRRKQFFRLASNHQNLIRALLFGNPLVHSTLTSTSSLLKSVGYRAEYAEDRIMYLDAAKEGAKLLLLPNLILEYSYSPHQLTRRVSRGEIVVDDEIVSQAIVDFIKSAAGNQSMESYLRRSLRSLCIEDPRLARRVLGIRRAIIGLTRP